MCTVTINVFLFDLIISCLKSSFLMKVLFLLLLLGSPVVCHHADVTDHGDHADVTDTSHKDDDASADSIKLGAHSSPDNI